LTVRLRSNGQEGFKAAAILLGPRRSSAAAKPSEGGTVAVKFLSEEWARELKEALNANPAFIEAVGSQSVKIQQVTSGPDGTVDYWLKIEGGQVDLGVGDIDGPDATITQDYATAVALARSELSPVSAFMTGKIKISGNMMVLMGLQNALAQLPGVMAEMDIDY
jgi:putative sterol carrier protein